jgi:hypothetical protein
MAYFSNGCQGYDYMDTYCARCVHGQEQEGPYCPVWALQHDLNRAQFENEALAAALESFITTGKDGRPGQCRMFAEAPRRVAKEQMALLEVTG